MRKVQNIPNLLLVGCLWIFQAIWFKNSKMSNLDIDRLYIAVYEFGLVLRVVRLNFWFWQRNILCIYDASNLCIEFEQLIVSMDFWLSSIYNSAKFFGRVNQTFPVFFRRLITNIFPKVYYRNIIIIQFIEIKKKKNINIHSCRSILT